MIIGYHASHEQFAPSELLAYVTLAEDAGFGAVMTSDHIAPWSVRQGNSGNNWAWLGAAMARTSIPFGSLAIPGGWRYHPAVLAHLISTIAEMFPGRLQWIAVGSGEALNEHILGKGWPAKDERNERLHEGTDLMRALLQGEEVTAHHPWVQIDAAKLWSPPPEAPAIYGAALTSKTTAWMGSWTDGLVTVRKSKEELSKLVKLYQENGGEGKPLALQLQVSWAQSKEEARTAAWEQWRHAAVSPAQLADLRRPEDFDSVTSSVAPADIDDVIHLVTEADELLAAVEECASCGFNEIYIHNVSRDQIGFLNFMKLDVFRRSGKYQNR
ncbi:MAG TPA: TIGR03885 family FMN-dependent LLM class oxidoreductase [Pseudorhizobium sp.]|nr:TIGR03885 family FMN-dependent LLM class oxidoreductase [Pseudorhizobium sp.]